MDLFKIKSFSKNSSRFQHANPLDDLTKPEVTGLLPSQNNYLLGTPNLTRRENVTLISSSSIFGDTVELSLRWHPDQASGLTTLVSELTLVIDDTVYRYDQIETYQPKKSRKVPYITQYGSAQSKLKLFICIPYNTMRLVFCGHIRSQSRPADDEKFIKLSCIMISTTEVFDFIDEYNPKCFKKLYDQKKIARGIEQAKSDLLFQDRHEQQIRINGECVIGNRDSKIKKNIIAWGFYVRHFLHAKDVDKPLKTKRIIAYCTNGQTFHIGSNRIDLDEMDFGCTTFGKEGKTYPISEPFNLDWTKINSETKEFELEICVNDKMFKCMAHRNKLLNHFYDIQMNGKKGWAWVSLEDPIDTHDELEVVKLNCLEHQKRLKEGRIAIDEKLERLSKCLVTSLSDLGCRCKDLVGAKAWSLGQLQARLRHRDLDYVVPSAIILTRFAYDLILEQNPVIEERVAKLEELIGSGDLENLSKECESLQKLVEEAKYPDSLREQLVSIFENNFDLDTISFAVRSSSWGEDEEDMSAAGQLTTVLCVKGIESILKATLTCLASKFSHANIEYKRQHAMPLNLPMAVVIQEMVECDKAGVLFTCDPTNGDQSIVTITANYGLGESVVSGQADPDTIRVKTNPTIAIEEIKIGSKMIVIDSDMLKNNSKETRNSYNKSKCCLNEEEIVKLTSCGKSLEEYFQTCRDIEWGFKGNQLYLLQSRPVTGMDAYTDIELLHEGDAIPRVEVEYCTRANIGEVMPHAVTPLTQSFYLLLWSVSGYRLGFKFADYKILSPKLAMEVFYVNWHSFSLLRNSLLFQTAGTQNSVMSKSMEISFFGHEVGEQPAIIEASRDIKALANVFRGIRFDMYTLGLKLMPMTIAMREKHLLPTYWKQLRELKYATGYRDNKMLGLYNQMKKIISFSEPNWMNHIFIILLSGPANMALTALLSKYIQDTTLLFSTLNKILALSPNVISAEIPERIESMTKLIRSKGREEVDKFIHFDTKQALDYINQQEQLSKEFKIFIQRFGHRCYNEYELSLDPWRLNLGAIVDMIKHNCKSPEKTKVKENVTLDQMLDSLEVNFSMKDRLLLKYSLIPKSQTYVATREQTKDTIVEHSDLIREATRMLACEMRRNLRIPDEGLFYYLLYDEVEPLIREPQPSIVMHAIRRRNMFSKEFKEPWLFDEIIETSDFLPNNKKPSKEIDAKLANAPKLFGTPASSGRVQAKVCLVKGFHEIHKVRPGEILLTHSTDIGFSPIFPLISGVITQVGGLISHGAVVAREYGLPSLLGIPNVTEILKDGEEVILDADNGVIIRMLEPAVSTS